MTLHVLTRGSLVEYIYVPGLAGRQVSEWRMRLTGRESKPCTTRIKYIQGCRKRRPAYHRRFICTLFAVINAYIHGEERLDQTADRTKAWAGAGPYMERLFDSTVLVHLRIAIENKKEEKEKKKWKEENVHKCRSRQSWNCLAIVLKHLNRSSHVISKADGVMCMFRARDSRDSRGPRDTQTEIWKFSSIA